MQKGNVKDNKALLVVYLVLSIAFIVFTTILSRTPSLTSSVRLVPFWSYAGRGYLRQVAFNVALFVPLGYFLSSVFSARRAFPILIALAASVCVELVQYHTCRGMLDVDDVISNVAGSAIGFIAYYWFGNKRTICFILLVAEITGCIIVSVLSFNYTVDVRVTEQFSFNICDVQRQNGKIRIEGECFLNKQSELDYQVLLVGANRTYSIRTVIEGESFVAEGNDLNDERFEVQVQFKGHSPMPTKTWIDGTEVEYVAQDSTPDGVAPKGVLKAYSSELDTYIYQDGNKLIWYIGWDIGDSTEIIYHVHTNEPGKLPESRVLYGYDNRGFRVGSSKEQAPVGKYTVFEDVIPREYNVTAVVVGFKTNGKIIWTESFRVK